MIRVLYKGKHQQTLRNYKLMTTNRRKMLFGLIIVTKTNTFQLRNSEKQDANRI